MLQSLSKIWRYLPILSIFTLSLIIALPVQAGTNYFDGVVNNLDPYEANCNDYVEVTQFYVTSDGGYVFHILPNFYDVTDSSSGLYAIISRSSNTSDSTQSKFVSVSSSSTMASFSLSAGQNYYLIMTGCGYMSGGSYRLFRYSISATGMGEIIMGDVANDTDVDGIANSSDNCPNNANANQQDTDGDRIGNVCDSTPNGDRDSDGVDNLSDNCPDNANTEQRDMDGDTIGDVCDTTPSGDDDNDGVENAADNCVNTSNPMQEDTDGDTIGDACDSTPSGDNDSDGVENAADNCVNTSNPMQEDADGDTIGDACDTTPSGDTDGDGVDNAVDNCPTDANAGQADNDSDGIGNRCDSTAHIDSDNDGIADRDDECLFYGDGGFGVAENGCPPNIVLPPDDRVNWQYGDLNVVVYRHEDGVAVYCYNGNSWLGMHINQALVDSWDTSQAQDVPVLEVDHAGCRTAFYILDSGEYQINIWTFEGKLYEIIADNLHFDNATMRYFDPNE